MIIRLQEGRLSAWTVGWAVLVLSGSLAAQDRALRPVRVVEKRALLIGNAEYQDTTPLTNTINDVDALAAALRDLGFESVSQEKNLTQRQMVQALRRFTTNLNAGDLAFFYFSGHGVQVNHENYLLPVDYESETQSGEVAYVSLPVRRVQDMLKETGARVRVMVLDACRNNPFRGTRSGAGGLAGMNADGDLIVYTTGAGDVASDNRGGELGLYMTHLLPELRRKRVELKEAFDRTRAAVHEAAQRRGESQRPAQYEDLIGRVYLRGSPEAGPGGTVAAAAVSAAAPPPAATAADRWAEIEGTEDARVLEAYVGRYREDPEAEIAVELAKQRLAELETARRVQTAQKDWGLVRGTRSVRVLEVYILKYGAVAGARDLVDQARSHLVALKQEQVVAEAQKAWAALAGTEDVEALSGFVRAYASVAGTGDLVGQARARLEALRSAEWTNSLGMEFVRVPAGEFVMGSESELARDGEKPLTQVRISREFYLGKTEVTQGQWEAVMDENPSEFQNCGRDCPVEKVSWEDVHKFIKRLNGMEGGARYRLPTEAEWEYAARGGTGTDTPAGDLRIVGRNNAPLLDGIAWYGGNSGVNYEGGFDCADWKEKQYDSKRCGPQPVGRKAPNPYGLHDMLGNVWEWVGDWHGAYPGGSVTDPTGPVTGSSRVYRGGGWSYSARHCRSAHRYHVVPGDRYGALGFRVLRTE